MTEYAIKARREGEPRWLFVGSKGVCTRLRIHACRWPSLAAADAAAEQLSADNPGIEFKAVPLGRANDPHVQRMMRRLGAAVRRAASTREPD